MDRRLKRHIPIAMLCGATVYVVLMVAAWYNLRGYVCRRQDQTRLILRILRGDIATFRKQNNALPRVLTDIPDFDRFGAVAGGPPVDAWNNLIDYSRAGESYELISYGRDRQPGGVGLDADLFDDDRNREQTQVTFAQFFTETDMSEVARGRLEIAGLIAGAMVSFMTFRSLREIDTSQKPLNPIRFVRHLLAIMGIAILVGSFLLVLHIPIGH